MEVSMSRRFLVGCPGDCGCVGSLESVVFTVGCVSGKRGHTVLVDRFSVSLMEADEQRNHLFVGVPMTRSRFRETLANSGPPVDGAGLISRAQSGPGPRVPLHRRVDAS